MKQFILLNVYNISKIMLFYDNIILRIEMLTMKEFVNVFILA